MGRSYSWTASIGGRTVADGTTEGRDDYTPERVEQSASTRVSLRTGVPASQVDVDVTERKSVRQQAAELRAARNR
jgi:hypothetical protein